VTVEQVRALALQVVVAADLQIPGVAHERELEQGLEVVARQHLHRGDHLGVARQLGGDAVPGQMVEPGAGPLQQVHRVAQL